MVQDYRFQVNLGGMIDILSNHIYNAKDIFIRELLQNATDAIRARQKLSTTFKGAIHVNLIENEEQATIVFEDNGIGLTIAEIHSFLATIASSSKGSTDFSIDSNDFIGRFGIGLLSCFIASSEIVLITTSAKNKETTEWRGKADGTYQIRKLPHTDNEPGTQIFLRAKKEWLTSSSLKEGNCFTVENLKQTLFKYGAMLEVPIIFADQFDLNADTRLFANKKNLYQASAAEILTLGKQLLAQEFKDYFLIESQSGKTYGIAYILPYAVQMTAKRKHTVFLNRMFVTHDNDNLLPKWAFFTRMILFTNELSPVASREDFYHNDKLEQIAANLGSNVKQGLLALEPKKLDRLITTHYLAFKSIAAEDQELLSFSYSFLPFITLNGEEKFADIAARATNIYYTHTVDDFRQIRDVARTRGIELINGGYTYDTALLKRISAIIPGVTLEHVEPDHFANDLATIPAEVDSTLSVMMNQLNDGLSEYDVKVALRQFDPQDLPILFINPYATQSYREMERSIEESNPLFGDLLNSLHNSKETPPEATLYLNFANPVIQQLFQQNKPFEQLLVIIKMLYIQALLLGHYPLKEKERQLMNTNFLKLLTLLSN